MKRGHYIGGTSAAAMVGRSVWTDRYTELYKIVCNILGLRTYPDRKNRDMERGLMMEPVVVELIKKRIGDIQRADDVMMVDPDIPYVGGHADGYSEDAVYEIKCPRKVKPVTEEWYWQGVHYVRLLNRLGLTETKTLRVVQLDYDAFDLVVDEYNVSADDMAELEYQLKRASDAISSVVAAKPESRTAAGELLERLVEPNKTFLKRRLHTDEYIEETLEKLKSLRKVRKQLDDEIRRLRETLPPNYYGRNIVFTNRYGVKVLR